MSAEERQLRIDALCKPGHFEVDVYFRAGHRITAEEDKRLRPKLELVKGIAARLAANMLKGTLKYDNDSYTLREWLEMGLDDNLDGVNYNMLALEKLDELEADMTGGLEDYTGLFGKAKRADGSGA